MRYSERESEEAEALKLREEVEDLRRQLREHQDKAKSSWHPSRH